MKIRFTAGSEVLRIADLLASDEALAPLSVEGALLVFDFADDLDQAAVHSAQRVEELAGLVPALDDDSRGEIAAGHSLGHGDRLADRRRDRACHEIGNRDAEREVRDQQADDQVARAVEGCL